MKVLLVSANTLNSPYPVYPLGLDYIAGAIADRHEVEIVDMNVAGELERLEACISEFGPHVVGLSIRNIDNTDATDPEGFAGQYAKVAESVRKSSDALLVLGGCGFTIFPEELMDLLGADYGIVGEGERFAHFLDALENSGNLRGMPGLAVAGEKTVVPVPWRGDFERGFAPGKKHVDFYLKKGGMLNLQTKRGCRFKCVYCTYPHIEGSRLRLVDPAQVADTALDLERAGAKYFFVTDSAFNVDVEHSLETARAFKKKGVTVPWGAFFAPTRPPDGYYDTMAECGLTHVEFGTESLCDPVLSAYRKPFRSAHVFEAHRKAVEAGLHAAHYFLMGGPGENAETVELTLSRIDKLEKTVIFFFCGMRIYPHTELCETATREGKIHPSQDLLAPVFYRPDSVGLEEIARAIEKRAKSRHNWIVGAGGESTARTLARMHERGFTGPLWEFLIR